MDARYLPSQPVSALCIAHNGGRYSGWDLPSGTSTPARPDRKSSPVRPNRPAVPLEQLEEPTPPVDVVVREVELLDAGIGERQPVLGAVALDEAVLDDPVDLGVDGAEVA